MSGRLQNAEVAESVLDGIANMGLKLRETLKDSGIFKSREEFKGVTRIAQSSIGIHSTACVTPKQLAEKTQVIP